MSLISVRCLSTFESSSQTCGYFSLCVFVEIYTLDVCRKHWYGMRTDVHLEVTTLRAGLPAPLLTKQQWHSVFYWESGLFLFFLTQFLIERTSGQDKCYTDHLGKYRRHTKERYDVCVVECVSFANVFVIWSTSLRRLGWITRPR